MSTPAPGDSNPDTGHAYLPPAPEEGRSLRTKLLMSLGVVVAVVVVLVLRATVYHETPPTADVGDCIAAIRQAGGQDIEANVVNCGSSEAAYEVVGKVTIGGTPIESPCRPYAKPGEQLRVFAGRSGADDFLLCLRAR